MADLALICGTCKRKHRLPPPPSGGLPGCEACGGHLHLAAPAVFTCRACGVRSKPAQADPNVRRDCPKCHQALLVMPATPSGETLVTHEVRKAVFEGEEDAPAPQAPPRPGTPSGLGPGAMFGRYQIERELARGGMGIVYVATDPGLKRKVALKVMIAGETASDDQVRRFVREARAAGQLHHPNIVAVHDAGEVDGRHYFTMDLVDGKELAHTIGSGMKLRDQVALMRTVCLALHHAHEHGIVHRDLKPANIMITRDGRPVVMDFGLAKDVGNDASFRSLSGVVQGTPSYMSPEQAQGRTREVDRRTDVYALGVILYELATGKRPFGGNTLFDTIRAVVNDEPEPPRALAHEVDAGLNAVILRCLEKDRNARYPTAQAMADDLGHWLAGEAVVARPQPPWVTAWRRLRQRPKVLAALAVACAVGITAAVTAMLVFGGDPLARPDRDLRSNDPARMRAAAVSLAAQYADPTTASALKPKVLALLRNAAQCGDLDTETTADKTLVAVRDQLAIPPLLAVAQDRGNQPPRRMNALGALAQLGYDDNEPATQGAPSPQALDASRHLVLVAAVDSDPALVKADGIAAVALDRDAGGEGISAILDDAQRPSAIRVAAIQALGETHPTMMGMAAKRLMRAAGDMDLAVSEAATKATNRLRSNEDVFRQWGIGSIAGDLVESMTKVNKQNADHNRELEALAAGANDGNPEVGTTPPPRVDPATVIAQGLSSKDPDLRLAAAYDLGHLRSATAVAPLTVALADGDGGVRRVAARSLVAIATRTEVPWQPIAALLDQNDPGVRADAARTLGELEAREAVPAMAARFGLEDEPRVRLAIVTAIGRCKDPRGLGAIREGLVQSAGVDQADYALACVVALGANKAYGGLALPDLIGALGHPSRSVREAAAAELADITGVDNGVDQARWKNWLANR